MLRLVVTYAHPENPEAMLEHYRTSHAVITSKMPHVRSYTWGVSTTLDGSKPPHFLVAVVDFDSKEDCFAALSSAEGQEGAADLEKMPHAGVTIDVYEFDEKPS